MVQNLEKALKDFDKAYSALKEAANPPKKTEAPETNIESNKFNFGFRGNDVLLWGALSDDEDDETVARKIMRQIRAARIGKQATNEALEKLNG
jgi:hypothetical protein